MEKNKDYFTTSCDINIENFIEIEADDVDWIITDPSCNQRMKVLTENSFMFKEDRTINPSTGETCEYESVIDLSEYTHEEMFESVSPFGYSFHEMSTWIDEGRNLSLIAECIFEMKN